MRQIRRISFGLAMVVLAYALLKLCAALFTGKTLMVVPMRNPEKVFTNLSPAAIEQFGPFVETVPFQSNAALPVSRLEIVKVRLLAALSTPLVRPFKEVTVLKTNEVTVSFFSQRNG